MFVVLFCLLVDETKCPVCQGTVVAEGLCYFALFFLEMWEP